MEQDKKMENEPTIDSSSQANVQTLLALFRQKDQPIMGILQPGCKVNSSSKISLPCNGESCDSDSNDSTVQNSSVEISRSLFFASQRKTSAPDISISSDPSAAFSFRSNMNISSTVKPVLKPKPAVAQKPVKSSLPNQIISQSRTCNISSDEFKPSQKENLSKETGDCEIINATELSCQAVVNSNTQACPSDTPEKHSSMQGNSEGNQNSSQTSQSLSITKFAFDNCSFTSDNYISKNNKQYKRKELPPEDKLGPAPLKPIRPLNVDVITLSIHIRNPPPLPDRTFKPSGPGAQSASSLPPKPSRAAPPPPPPVISRKDSNSCEEELYGDTETPCERKKRPVSLIPEYTEEEELGSRDSTDLEELYADGEADVPLLPSFPLPVRPNKPPPPVPLTSPEEEFYQDALEPEQEEVYEEMPADLHTDEQETPLYDNKRDQEKSRKDEEKRIRKEQEKREKELTKLRKKYALTGQETPVDTGLVKADSRGGWYDLSVRKGETVLILRMENNPSGKWLVKNEKGKIGYVELTNIEVMTLRRSSSQSASEELYYEVAAEEAIYEETY